MRFLKQLGANYVFDTTFARDFSLTERYFTACAMGLACAYVLFITELYYIYCKCGKIHQAKLS